MKLFYLLLLLTICGATGAAAQTRPKPGAAPVRLTTKEKLKARAEAEIARREAVEQAAAQAKEAEEKADKERREKSKALDRARKKNGGLNLDEPAEDLSKPKIYIGKVKLSDPVLVYYQQAPPGVGRQQLVMDKANLGLLAKLSTEDLMLRREVFVDGLGNYALPGTDQTKTRLVGASLVADDARKPAPDGRSTYVKLKVKGPGDLYVVRESADEYRHFVKGKVQESVIDFNVNSLSGVDSVRAVYTLRKIDASERGAGSGDIIR
ncbi:hypothetical protein [uncultured Hymenobacter sp.]|uniref:hypothetical protein n=1 Tax=uncultured Hymenobacter sp. TaxID=170016 RepID=UPI0035CB5A17